MLRALCRAFSVHCILTLFPLAAFADTLSDCKEISAAVNKTAPQYVDKITVLTGSLCSVDGRVVTIIYKYRLETKAQIDQSKINTLRPAALNTICTDPDIRPMLNLMDVHHSYYDAKGRYVGKQEFNRRDCR